MTSHTQGSPLATEAFGYDKLHRLISSQRNGAPMVQMNYHGNGNLKYKTDVSQLSETAYSYGARPHTSSSNKHFRKR